MLVFCIKQLLSLKRAILGRREPHQLAWGMALGVWLGVVPYGNLVALAILLFILSVRVNHGMVAVTAVLTSVIAAWFDAQTHAVGKYVLTHPQLTPQLSAAWQWPLVPWTDLNNTLVMGGLLVGLAAVVPIYLLSYPLFRHLAPAVADSQGEPAEPSAEVCEAAASDETVGAHAVPAAEPKEAGVTCCTEAADGLSKRSLGESEVLAVDAALDALEQEDQSSEGQQPVELIDTRIEVVRLVEVPATSGSITGETTSVSTPALPVATQSAMPVKMAAEPKPPADPPMGEALNYLLRQLRDARERRAA